MVRMSIYFPDDLHEALRTKAFHHRTSINKLVLEAVQQSLKGERKRKPKMAAKRGR